MSKAKKEVDYFARNKKSRRRGYSFEHWLVQKIESYPTKWYARRLGGTSTNMPDILAVNNEQKKMLAIEAKSAMGKSKIYIPEDEVQRCIDMVEMFSLYEDRAVIFSFKFSVPKSSKPLIYHFSLSATARKRMEMHDFDKLYCNRWGECFLEVWAKKEHEGYEMIPTRLEEFSFERLGIFQTPIAGFSLN